MAQLNVSIRIFPGQGGRYVAHLHNFDGGDKSLFNEDPAVLIRGATEWMESIVEEQSEGDKP